MNDWQKKRFAQNMVSSMFNTVSGKKIAVLGFAFKKDTGDTRETPAMDVCAMLLQDGAVLHVYDPQVTRAQALMEFKDHNMDFDFDTQFITESSAQNACREAHAIVVMTEWDEFK